MPVLHTRLWIVALLLCALVLHTSLIRYGRHTSSRSTGQRIFAIALEPTPVTMTATGRPVPIARTVTPYVGMFGRAPSRDRSVLLGLVLPIVLLTGAADLEIRLRRRQRRARGACDACGHAAVGAGRCPECGLMNAAVEVLRPPRPPRAPQSPESPESRRTPQSPKSPRTPRTPIQAVTPPA